MEPKTEVGHLLVHLTAAYQAPSCALTPDMLRSGYSVPPSAEGKPRLREVKCVGLSLTACSRQNQVEIGPPDSKFSL